MAAVVRDPALARSAVAAIEPMAATQRYAHKIVQKRLYYF
jgi:hypothetical protein